MIILLDTETRACAWDYPLPAPPFGWQPLYNAMQAACSPQVGPMDALWPACLLLLDTLEAQGLALSPEMMLWRTRVKEFLA